MNGPVVMRPIGTLGQHCRDRIAQLEADLATCRTAGERKLLEQSLAEMRSILLWNRTRDMVSDTVQ